MLTGAGRGAAGEADLRAFKLRPAFCALHAVQTHPEAAAADGYAVIADGKVPFINRGTSPSGIQVNEGLYAMVTAVLIVGHGIVRRVQQEFGDIDLWQELEHGEPGIQETVGIVPGGWAEQGENREVAFRVGGSEHIQVIAKVVAFPVGVPANVTVRLVIEAAAFTIADTFFQAIAGTGLSFPGTGINRGAVPGNGEAVKIDKALINGDIKEAGAEDLKEPACGGKILRRFNPESRKEAINRYFFDRRCFLPFPGFYRFFLRGMKGVRDVVLFREPQAVKKVIESTGSRSVADVETGKDGIKKVLLENGSPGSNGGNFESQGEQVRAEHVGGKPWKRPENGIAVLHDDINRGKIQGPKPFDGLPGGRIKRRVSVWIIFMKLVQDTFLVGGMTADVNRFQDVHLQLRVKLVLN